MKEFLLSRFKGDLAFIENNENYYAMCKYVIDKCANAQLENILLYEQGHFTDDEYTCNVSRIQRAKERAIATHGEWTIKMLEQSKTQHTMRTLVSSVYADIWGIQLKGDEEIHSDLFAEFDVTDKTADEIAYKVFGRKVQYKLIHEFCGYHFDEPLYSFKDGIITLLIFSKYGHPYGSIYPYGSISVGNIYEELNFEYKDGELQIENFLREQHDLAEVLADLLLNAINIKAEDMNTCPSVKKYKVADKQLLIKALCLADQIKNCTNAQSKCKNCNK